MGNVFSFKSCSQLKPYLKKIIFGNNSVYKGFNELKFVTDVFENLKGGSFFLKFWHGLSQKPVGNCLWQSQFWENCFLVLKSENGSKIVFRNLLKPLVITFFLNLAILFTIFFSQITYLGKIWFLSYGLKCSLPIRSQNF